MAEIETPVEVEETTTEEVAPEATTEKTEGDKPKETPQQKKARLERQLKKVRKELGETDDEEDAEVPAKKGELSYGQMALLRADGIKGSDELALVKEYLASGKQLLDVMENKHFLNDLKDLRDAKATKDATPSGTKRSGNSTRDDVDYWLAKGPGPEGLPKDNPELARKVVAARKAQIATRNQFSDEPIV